jgi:hypothetical protein
MDCSFSLARRPRPRGALVVALAAIPFCAVACSAEGDAGFGPNGGTSAPEAGTAPGTSDDAAAPAFAGACSMPTAPAGAGCACHFTACHGCAIECDCAADCYESTASCLVNVDASGKPKTTDPLLSTGSLSCTLHPAVEGEFSQPAQMVCTETNCHLTQQPPPVADAGSQPPPPTDAGDAMTPQTACPVPVPGAVVLPGPVWGEYQVHFDVPFPSYAFAAAHAAMQTQDLGAFGFRETPSSFFATSLKESYMGCSDKLPAYNAYMPGYLYTRTASYASGCLQIDSEAWLEICQMYPETFDCSTVMYGDVIPSTNQDTTGRDNFASSAWVKAYYDVWSYAMLTTHNMPSPGAWFAGASDPQAMVKVEALLYNEGAWTGDATTVEAGCQHDLIENCLGNKDYVFSVGSYAAELEATVAAGNCYNDTVAVTDVDDYVSKIAPLFTHENAAALTAAGRQAFLTASGGAMSAPFQKVAGAVLKAIDAGMQARLHCPGAELTQYYMLKCPPM